MADVQPENGFTKIADEILEQMARIKLSPTQYRLLFVVWRYTYGFNRKEHDLTLGFFEKATGCEKRQIQRELKELEERKIIFQKVVNGKGRKIKFNKNHDEWVGKTTIGETTIGETTIGEIDNTTIGETTKGTLGETTNQDIQKTNLKTYMYTPEFEQFWSKYPRRISKKATYDRWKKVAKTKTLINLIVSCAENYAKVCADKKTDEQYILHPTTFLNKERYMDYETYTTPYKPTNKTQPRLELIEVSAERRSELESFYNLQIERNAQRNAAP